MPVYAYIVRDDSDKRTRGNITRGNITRGTIAGDSPRHARQILRERGLRIIELTEQTVASRQTRLTSLWPGKRNETHLANFLGELSTLLAVGVPLLESLDTLREQYRGRFGDVVLHLRDRIQSGASLAQAMQDQSSVFDPLCISMAEVGENAGNLDETLQQLAQFKQKSLLFKDKILSAMLYPTIILCVSLGVAIFLMTVVIPMLLTNLVEAGRPLPWPTQVLKSMSDFLLAYGWLMAAVLAVFGIAILFARKTRRGKRFFDSLVLRMPLLGNLSRKQEIGRLALMVSTLLKSGVEFVRSIEIAQGTTRNVLLQEALESCKASVTRGKDIGQAVRQSSYFPPMVAQIFTIGQKSGELERMLGNLAVDYDRQVESSTTRLTATIEPVMILTLSVFVGFILFATILPILEAADAL